MKALCDGRVLFCVHDVVQSIKLKNDVVNYKSLIKAYAVLLGCAIKSM